MRLLSECAQATLGLSGDARKWKTATKEGVESRFAKIWRKTHEGHRSRDGLISVVWYHRHQSSNITVF
jgi:hypothetical protein